MANNVLQRQTALWLLHEELADEILRALADEARELEVHLENPSVRLRMAMCLERGIADEAEKALRKIMEAAATQQAKAVADARKQSLIL